MDTFSERESVESEDKKKKGDIYIEKNNDAQRHSQTERWTGLERVPDRPLQLKVWDTFLGLVSFHLVSCWRRGVRTDGGGV